MRIFPSILSTMIETAGATELFKSSSDYSMLTLCRYDLEGFTTTVEGVEVTVIPNRYFHSLLRKMKSASSSNDGLIQVRDECQMCHRPLTKAGTDDCVFLHIYDGDSTQCFHHECIRNSVSDQKDSPFSWMGDLKSVEAKLGDERRMLSISLDEITERNRKRILSFIRKEYAVDVGDLVLFLYRKASLAFIERAIEIFDERKSNRDDDILSMM